ncbi:hypothetical protein B0H17DRAFT_1203375 [Mycena rosella]|uniref:Uncharacterized protein n=1 Tax=Mycena rosella TaxID=1033263 RepID=A0AAD7DDN2_MYCRO|nr:hypothetical protein B0H17DRAFT_1203375 [Mycena rosella]
MLSYADTSREICRVVVRMWVAGVCAGLDPLISPDGGAEDPPAAASHVVEGWCAEADGLIAWLEVPTGLWR